MISVQVRLYATLRKYRPEIPHGQSFTVELATGSKIRDLLQELGIPEGEMKQAFVNGIIQGADYVLADGDSLGVFSPVAGGCSRFAPRPWQLAVVTVILNPSYGDHKMLTALDMPEVIPVIVETNDPGEGPYGTKELGMGAVGASGAANVNAINDSGSHARG